MAEWSKAPDSSSGLREKAWVQIPLLTFKFFLYLFIYLTFSAEFFFFAADFFFKNLIFFLLYFFYFSCRDYF
ncbi:hypothetical protein ACSBR2_041204 [Camellia fascicularis]